MSKLHLGCGNNILEGYVNMDYYSEKADVKHDMEVFPYPFKDNEFDHVLAYGVIEHISQDKLLQCLQEIRRITKIGGTLEMTVPHNSCGGEGVPFHRSRWHYYAFPRKMEDCTDCQFKAAWKGWRLIFCKIEFHGFFKEMKEAIFNKIPYLYETTGLRYLFPANMITAILKKEAGE